MYNIIEKCAFKSRIIHEVYKGRHLKLRTGAALCALQEVDKTCLEIFHNKNHSQSLELRLQIYTDLLSVLGIHSSSFPTTQAYIFKGLSCIKVCLDKLRHDRFV